MSNTFSRNWHRKEKQPRFRCLPKGRSRAFIDRRAKDDFFFDEDSSEVEDLKNRIIPLCDEAFNEAIQEPSEETTKKALQIYRLNVLYDTFQRLTADLGIGEYQLARAVSSDPDTTYKMLVSIRHTRNAATHSVMAQFTMRDLRIVFTTLSVITKDILVAQKDWAEGLSGNEDPDSLGNDFLRYLAENTTVDWPE